MDIKITLIQLFHMIMEQSRNNINTVISSKIIKHKFNNQIIFGKLLLIITINLMHKSLKIMKNIEKLYNMNFRNKKFLIKIMIIENIIQQIFPFHLIWQANQLCLIDRLI